MQPEEFPDIKQIKQKKKKKRTSQLQGKSRSKGTQAERSTESSQDNGVGG